MAAEPTLDLTVYDKAFTRTGYVADLNSYDVRFRHGAQSTATFMVDDDHRYLTAMIAQGARGVVTYGTQKMSGVLVERAGDSGPPGTLTLTLQDDWRLGSRILGWPNPGGAITAQGAATAYATHTGPAETVVKAFITENKNRLGIPVTVATDQARGATVTVKSRMHPLWDRLIPVVTDAGVGVSILQSGTSLRVDCYTPVTLPYEINPESGVVESYAWVLKSPTATRAVIGGQGEGTSREFRLVVDAARETAWNDVIEVFVDARDTNVASELDARGQQALTEGAATTTLSMTLSDNDVLRFGGNVRVGDKFATRLVPGASPVTVTITEAALTLGEEGAGVQLVVGERTDDPSRGLWNAVAALARAVRNDRAGR